MAHTGPVYLLASTPPFRMAIPNTPTVLCVRPLHSMRYGTYGD